MYFGLLFFLKGYDIYIYTHTHTHTHIYRVFRVQDGWTLTHTSHKDTEQSTIEASVTPNGVTLTDTLIR
jgi:hypothetical protein